jgi:hypothetical protein
MKKGSGTMHLMPIGLALASVAASAASHSVTELRLDVGPGVTAGFSTPGSDIECTDSARCRVDLPVGSLVEVYARSSRQVRWQGCDMISAKGRCVVTIGREPVRIIVR